MLSGLCKSCGNRFKLEDVEVEKQDIGWMNLPVASRCPHCDAELPEIRSESVEIAKILKLTYILPSLLSISLALISIELDILNYTGPIMVAMFGVWLTKTAKLKDHRIIGWLLIALSAALLWFLAQ